MKVTTEFDPAIDPEDQVLAVVEAAYTNYNEATTTGGAGPLVPAPTETVAFGGFTLDRMRSYCPRLTDFGQETLARIAREGTVKIDVLIAETGQDGNYFGGKMSTIGHAKNQVPGLTDRPFKIDETNRLYIITPAVAEMALTVLAELGVI